MATDNVDQSAVHLWLRHEVTVLQRSCTMCAHVVLRTSNLLSTIWRHMGLTPWLYMPSERDGGKVLQLDSGAGPPANITALRFVSICPRFLGTVQCCCQWQLQKVLFCKIWKHEPASLPSRMTRMTAAVHKHCSQLCFCICFNWQN